MKLKEDVAVNSVGSGAIAGLGVGKDGEPGISKKNKKKAIPFKLFIRKQPNGNTNINT